MSVKRQPQLQGPGAFAIVPSMMTTDRLVEFVLKTTLADCPDAVLPQIRRAALDTIGCMLAGAAEPVASIVREVARTEGGLPLCTVVGTSLPAAVKSLTLRHCAYTTVLAPPWKSGAFSAA